MKEIIVDSKLTKSEKYEQLWPQFKALIGEETNLLANLSNTTALLKQTFNWWWVGFYFVNNESNELILGPFQGPVACTRIQFGKGVCGKVWEMKKTLIVPNVDLFPGHIACSSESKSEIVIPLISKDSIIGVLDIDSENLESFDKTDQIWLEKFVEYLIK